MDTQCTRAGLGDIGIQNYLPIGLSGRNKPRMKAVWSLLAAMSFAWPSAHCWAQAEPTPAAPPAQSTPPDKFQPSPMDPGYPSLDAPWTKGKASKPKAAPAPPPAAAPAPAAETPAPAADAAATTAATPETAAPAQPHIRRNEISVSGDYFLGEGNVTLPFGFGLANALNQAFPGLDLHGTVNKADRTSDYFGGTISYSYGQTWYLDLAYAHGSSSGTVPVSLSSFSMFEVFSSSFSIDDNWYQAYIRYTFPSLSGLRWSAYLRAGVSYVDARLTDLAPVPVFGVYSETDNTKDLLGNLGFGVGYSLYAKGHFRVGLQVEGEGFYGHRTQDVSESIASLVGETLPPITIDNNLYGAIGRGTARFEYRPGRSGAFKIFVDGGVQAKYTFITYPSGLGTFDELLWGPYVKAGLRYSF